MKELFRDLQPLAGLTPGKPDPHENLTDILELVAVSTGIRLAHLQGHGQHDEERLATIERIAHSHGLRTLRTPSLKPFFHRAPRYDQGIVEWQSADDLENQHRRPEVVWVYSDDRLAAAVIPDVVAGDMGVADALGYPSCCVIHDSERKLAMAEAYVQGIIDTYHPATPDEVFSLWKQNVKVQITVDPDVDIGETGASLRRFPYVQFVACPTCLAHADSLAASTNGRMRDLAFELSPSFGRQIWQARDLVVNKGRPIPVGRNDACPCGSGSKFKWCCL
jgi:uncharacterized protein YchJ